MTIEFYKYQGTGNDFVIIDNRRSFFKKDIETIKFLCDRKFGVGSDGLICIEKDGETDFYMDFYNPDGSQSFCGNGSRCAVAFAVHTGIVGSTCTFRAIDGIHHAEFNNGMVSLGMGDVDAVEKGDAYMFINTGSPHYIQEFENVDALDMIAFGKEIRYSDKYKAEGTNVNAVQKIQDGIKMRTYERGVENETLSCGTGVTAAALSAIAKGWYQDQLKVETLGGTLEVKADYDQGGFKNVVLSGPAKFVFKGEIDV